VNSAVAKQDVIIAGAGPAGSSLAIHLARQGRTVLLLDRSSFPREKACGEGVMPAGVAALGRLGIAVDGAPFYGVRYHHGDRMATGRFPGNGQGMGVRRSRLDAALLDVARAERNVEVRTNTPVDALLHRGNTVIGIRADEQEFHAPLIVAADGANSNLRHKLGWDASRPSRRFGLRRHYRANAAAEPWVDVHLTPECETYVTRLPDRELLVATLGNSRCPLPPQFRDLDPIDEPLGASPLAVRASRRFDRGIVLMGDAAGSCDPITGGGISQALLSSELLAQHLATEFPPSLETLAKFDAARERMLLGYRGLTWGVLALAARPRLFAPVVSVLKHSPTLFSRLLAVAGGAA
jgi:menaquinone-9 beta-reductase